MMYGGVPPVQVRRVGWHSMTLAGVLIVSWAKAVAAAAKTTERQENLICVTER